MSQRTARRPAAGFRHHNPQLPPAAPARPDNQATFTDDDFWNGLNLELPALAPVAKLYRAGDRSAAATALVRHFRTRTTPKISPYHTDEFWDDWPDMPVVRRADLFLSDRTVVPSGHSVVPIQLAGKPGDPFGIDWSKAQKAKIAVARQRLTAEMVASYEQTGAQKYADGVESFLRAYAASLPFAIDPAFHPDDFASFGGRGHEQLASCYHMFCWGDLLQSKLFRDVGRLSDEFWFWFLKQHWFYHMQFSRFIGAPFRADNHHLMERGVTLYFQGVQFPEYAYAQEMETYSREIIRKHFDHNILKDGAGSEHCMSYQYRCFIRYALPDSVGRLNGRDLLGPARAKKMKEFLLFQGLACQPNGQLPTVGDGDGAPISEIVSQSGAMYLSPELKAIDQAIGTQCQAVNSAFRKAFAKVKPRLPDQLAAIYPIGGHLMLRDGWKKDSNFMWLSLKNGSLYNVHTHWDTLSFHLSAYGVPIIGDPVGSTYGRMQDDARGYYFSMDAHNGLIVDDDILTSYKALAKWWGGQPSRIDSAFSAFQPQAGVDYVSFSHPGYRPLMVRRDVLFVHDKYWIVTDAIDMNFKGFNSVFGSEGDIRPHEYTQPLHFEAGVPVQWEATKHQFRTTLPNSANLLIVPEPFEDMHSGLKIDRHVAALDPAPAPCMVGEIRRETIGKCFFSTLYVPFRSGRNTASGHNTETAPEIVIRPLTPRQGPYRHDEFHAIEIQVGAERAYWVTQRNRANPKRIVIEHENIRIETDAAAAYLRLPRGWEAVGNTGKSGAGKKSGAGRKLPIGHPGLEHVAGVTMGGTFILVTDTRTNTSVRSNQRTRLTQHPLR